nr:hypothetical protein CFP56_62728 [Quercus suber]
MLGMSTNHTARPEVLGAGRQFHIAQSPSRRDFHVHGEDSAILAAVARDAYSPNGDHRLNRSCGPQISPTGTGDQDASPLSPAHQPRPRERPHTVREVDTLLSVHVDSADTMTTRPTMAQRLPGLENTATTDSCVSMSPSHAATVLQSPNSEIVGRLLAARITWHHAMMYVVMNQVQLPGSLLNLLNTCLELARPAQ